MKQRVAANNKSIDNAGITSDYKQAIAELIWNGFDAKATKINISFTANELGYIAGLTISDNGDGIDFTSITNTFGAFLDSQKKRTFQRTLNTRGKKGKGRFSFIAFANKALWRTRYLNDNELLQYDILIQKSSKEYYDDTNHIVVNKDLGTGTDLHLSELDNKFSANNITNKEFIDYISKEFGWFLYLNKDRNFAICINDVPIDYEYLIKETDLVSWSYGDYFFNITFIRWAEKIGDKCYYYYINNQKYEIAKELTSFNNKSIDFYHSVYVESAYFDNFEIEEKPHPRFDGIKNQSDAIYKWLNRQLKSYIAQRQKMFIREQAADKLISTYEKNGVIPQFKNNQYDKDRRNDLVNTIRDIYCIQPKIFQGLNVEQGKTCVGFLNLLLDTDERENILNILEDIVRLSNEERLQLAQTLKRTSLNKILRTIKMIENRCAVVEMLRAIVYDLTKFATERNHIQQIIEDNYWLFGEQFNLVSADKPFEHALSEYLYILDGEKKSPQTIKSNERKRRPDIFICRKRGVDDTNDFSSIWDENIIVELKRPSVIIGKEQFRQIEDYLDLIKREAKFNSQLRKWKFIVVGNKVDDYILEQYDSFKSYNKRFLVHIKEQFEIYAMTWDDIFQAFDIKHRFLLDKLDIDRVAIQDEYNLGNLLLDQTSATRLTQQIKGLHVN